MRKAIAWAVPLGIGLVLTGLAFWDPVMTAVGAGLVVVAAVVDCFVGDLLQDAAEAAFDEGYEAGMRDERESCAVLRGESVRMSSIEDFERVYGKRSYGSDGQWGDR